MHKVLIIDDHDQIKQMLERRLSKIGYQIFMVSSGEEAKHLLKDQSIDLILLDYLLPEYTGFDFFVEFNKAYNIPIIMMTAHPSLHLAIEFLREGGADFVEKPIDIDILDIKIKRAIANDIRLKEEITARKTAELKLKNTNQELVAKTVILEDLNAELEVFTSSVSHDLKSPLRLISSFSQLLKNKYQNQLDEQGQDYINTIVQSSQKMYVLINDLLNLSKTSTQELNIGSIDLDTFIPGIIKDILPCYPDLKTEIKTINLPIIQGDATLVYQLFYNLIDNALKYSSNNKVSEVEIGSIQKGKKSLIYVKDNGVGFDMQYADKVFKIFVRLHLENEFTGTGVGLANVKRIMSKHNGDVWVESALGEGSTFYMDFPS
jgi:two-component system, sensor histidine kinase and response regulator